MRPRSHALDLEGIANAKVPEADVLHAVATHTGPTFAELGDVNGAARRGHPGRHPAVAKAARSMGGAACSSRQAKATRRTAASPNAPRMTGSV